MTILAWTLGLPVAASVLAWAYARWAARPRGPVETRDSVAAYERFKTAIGGSGSHR
jgi:hypothetical protein